MGVTEELARYLHLRGVEVLGDPYVEFVDVPNTEARHVSGGNVSFLGLTVLHRITSGRWLAQWMSWGLTPLPSGLERDVVEFLDGERNSALA